MRHVLEHNYEWEKILRNACQSFTERFVLILFTPFVVHTDVFERGFHKGMRVPDLSFKKETITDILDEYNLTYKLEKISPSSTQYGNIFCVD